MSQNNLINIFLLLQGSYSLENYTLNTDKWSEDVERGEYKAQFTMAQPSGECLYGQETEWKIADKVQNRLLKRTTWLAMLRIYCNKYEL